MQLFDDQGNPITVMTKDGPNYRGIAWVIRALLRQGVPEEVIAEVLKQEAG